MSLIYSLGGELHIRSPEGTVQIDVSETGVVHVKAVDGDGNPMKTDKLSWFKGMLKAGWETIKTGKPPAGFQVGGTEPVENREWYRKMFLAALDAVFRGRAESRIVRAVQGPTKLPNGLVFHPGRG